MSPRKHKQQNAKEEQHGKL